MRFLTLFLVTVIMAVFAVAAQAQPLLPDDAIAYGGVQNVTAAKGEFSAPVIYLDKHKPVKANGFVLFATCPFRYRRWSTVGKNTDSLITIPVDTVLVGQAARWTPKYPVYATVRDCAISKFTIGAIAGSDTVWCLPFYFKVD